MAYSHAFFFLKPAVELFYLCYELGGLYMGISVGNIPCTMPDYHLDEVLVHADRPHSGNGCVSALVGGHVSIFTVHKIVYSHAKKVGDFLNGVKVGG